MTWRARKQACWRDAGARGGNAESPAGSWKGLLTVGMPCGYVTTSSSPYLPFLLPLSFISFSPSLSFPFSLCLIVSLPLSVCVSLCLSLSPQKMFCHLIIGTNIVGCWALLDSTFPFQVEKKECKAIYKTVSIIS